MIWLTSSFSWKDAVARVKAAKRTKLVSLSESERAAWRPPPNWTVSEFADRERVLQASTSRIPGRWKTSVTPYLRDVMNEYNVPTTRHVVLCAGTQLGKTECLYNVDAFIIACAPSSTLLLYPRAEDDRMIFRTRFRPLVMSCDSIRAMIPAERKLFQTREQHFPGMVHYLAGSNSEADLASKVCPNILRDEIDKFPEEVGGDGSDALSLSEARAKSCWDIRKIYDVSSPKKQEAGIWRQLQNCDEIRQYRVPCPHCGSDQVLEWERVRWEKTADDAQWSDKIASARTTAKYHCIDCGKAIDDEDKPQMLARGRWVADIPAKATPEMVGYWISSLYSPFLSWGDIAAEFVRADRDLKVNGKRGRMREFVNGWLARPWVEKKAKEIKPDALAARKNNLPPRTAPAGTAALTAGIDVQKRGFYASVWAWSREMASHCIHYEFLPDWENVRGLVFDATFDVVGGQPMRIWRAGIDTGGTQDENDEMSRTAEVYNWVRENGGDVVFCTKGMSKNRHPGQMIRHSIIDKMPGKAGAVIPGGIILWLLDTEQLKDLVSWRLTGKDGDPQPVSFHSGSSQDLFNQLTAEVKKPDRNNRWRWQKIRVDNHYLDTMVIAHAMADIQMLGGVPILARLQDEQTAEEANRDDDREGDNHGGGWLPGSRSGWVRGR